MPNRGVVLVWSLLLLTLRAQDALVLPDGEKTQTLDTITPVPLPGNLFGSPDLLQPAMPKELKIDNKGLVEGSIDTGVRLGGPVKIDGDNGLQIFSDTAVVNLKDKSVTLEGHVSVYQGNLLQRGRRAMYYYERKFLDSRDLSISVDPIIMEADELTVEERKGKQVIIGEDAWITTHDVEKPNFWVRAAETKVYPGDKITFKNLRVYAGDVPVFWLPYLSQPLNAELGYHFIPGARSNWGPYLLNTYGIMLGGKLNPQTGENEDAWLLSKWRVDLRSTRGVGTGVDFQDIRLKDNKNLSGLSLYYMYDISPETENSGVPRGYVDPNRYSIELKHRQSLDIPDEATWYFDSNLTWLSDNYYLEDLEPQRYRIDPQPDNTLGLFRRDEKSLASLFTRMQVNDFQRTATRLPELAFDQAKAPLFGLPVLHEGTTSFAVLGLEYGGDARNNVLDPLLALPPGDPAETALLDQLPGNERQIAQLIRSLPPGDARAAALKDQLLNVGFTRFNTYQEFSLPMMIGNSLSLTPQGGVGYSRYNAVEGPATSDGRTYLHAGTEAAMKFSKTLGDLKNHDWGLDGLLHVIQPYANWSILAADELDPAFPRVDRLTYSTQPPTLSPMRYTATDDLRNWNIVRLGMRNRLLTRRDAQMYEWLYLNTYMDAFINDPEMDRNFSNLYNDFRFQPLPWMACGIETQFPVLSGGSGFNVFATYLRYLPTPDMEFKVGYRVLNNHPFLLDSNQVILNTYFRLNQNWGVGTQHVVELDDRTLEVQQYTLHRDLGNWVAGVGLTCRDNRVQQQYGIVFSLTLKDFPLVKLPFQIDAP
jgi:LPS-assembly protein